jgi:hypothetical protein
MALKEATKESIYLQNTLKELFINNSISKEFNNLFNTLNTNAIHHRMAHPTGMAHFVADLPLHLNITTPQQAI